MTENVLISGTYMDPTIVSDLAAHNLSATVVALSQLQNTDLSRSSGLWLGYFTNFDNSTGNLGGHISSFIAHGGERFRRNSPHKRLELFLAERPAFHNGHQQVWKQCPYHRCKQPPHGTFDRHELE